MLNISLLFITVPIKIMTESLTLGQLKQLLQSTAKDSAIPLNFVSFCSFVLFFCFGVGAGKRERERDCRDQGLLRFLVFVGSRDWTGSL